MNFDHLNISVVGLGVIGGSFAYHLNRLNFKNIWGIDRDVNTLVKAEENQMISKGFNDPKYPLEHSDIIVLCTYPESIISFVEEHMPLYKSGAIILDTCGIKSKIINDIHIDRKDIDFIGGHPMSGNEGKGISSASKTLFDHANFILTPTEKNQKENILLITKILKDMGFGKISQVSPKIHDQMIGYTSQLPHIIAAAIINSQDNHDITRFTGNSFGEFTRIATMNAPLWADLVLGNKDNIIEIVDAFMIEMDRIKDTILEQNYPKLEEIFTECTRKKEEMK